MHWSLKIPFLLGLAVTASINGEDGNRFVHLDEALRTLARIDAAKQTGSWGATTYAIEGDLLTVAGRKSAARAAYQNALAKPWREAIEKKIR